MTAKVSRRAACTGTVARPVAPRRATRGPPIVLTFPVTFGLDLLGDHLTDSSPRLS